MSVDVSVIIPTFRRADLLDQAIKSIFRQSGVTFEVLVIDDSPEGSAEAVVAGCGDPRVTYLKNPVPSGGFPSVVRNIGWPLARGELVHFFDDDDIVPDDHYSTVKTAFSQHKSVGVVFGRVEPFGDAPQTQMQGEHEFFRNAARRASACSRFGPIVGFTASLMFGRTLLVCGAAVIRRECVRLLGGFDPEIQLGEDVDFFARAIREFGAHFIDRVTLRYRIGSPSLMHAPVQSERQIVQHREGFRRMQAKYRLAHGRGESLAMKGLSRLVIQPCSSLLH